MAKTNSPQESAASPNDALDPPPAASASGTVAAGASACRGESALDWYARYTSGDTAYWLTASGWLRLADDLTAAGNAASDMRGPAEKMWDRAADCRARADRLTRGAL